LFFEKNADLKHYFKMSDTWSDIQATKNKQSSLREKLLRRRREREGILADISGPSAGT
jgi:hypothetical protein